MIFEPQIPKWGLIEFEQHKEKLVNFDNFVTLTSQYREYIKNKTWKTN